MFSALINGQYRGNMSTIESPAGVIARRIERKTIMNRKTKTLSAIILVAALSVSTAEAVADSLPPGILACANEKDVMVRLACYDREVAALVALPPAPVAPPPIAVVPSVAPQTDRAPVQADAPSPVVAATTAPQANVGNSTEPKPASDGVADFGYDQPVETITAKVVEIRKRPYGEMVMRLDNGQTWEQKHVDRRFKLSVGDTVTIKKGKVSGYRLSGSGNKTIQVTRRK